APAAKQVATGTALEGGGPVDLRSGSEALPVRSGELAALAYHVIAELLALMQIAHPGTLHRGDVDKHVLPAIGGLNESVAFLAVEELHGTLSHIWPPLKTPIGVHDCTTIVQRPSEFSVVLESALYAAGSKNRQNRTRRI